MTKKSDSTLGVPSKIVINNIGDFIREIDNGLLGKVDLKIEDMKKILVHLTDQEELPSPFKHNCGENICLDQKI